jgi:hypothetical protein
LSTAAYKTLCALFTKQVPRFVSAYASATFDASGVEEGRAYGDLVATALLADRKDDPGSGDNGYAPLPLRGRHRVDPLNPSQGYHAPFYGARSRNFAVTTRFGLDAPPTLGSAEYIAALREVKAKGIEPSLAGTLPTTANPRIADETLIGVFWGYDGAAGLGTPPRLYNQIVRAVAVKQGNTEEKNAELFARVNAAMADAGILAWEQKYKHDLWRPVVAIREHDGSMGPGAATGVNNIDNLTQVDWLPLGAPASNSKKPGPTTWYGAETCATMNNFTPPFPAYPSGHATFGAAALQSVRRFYSKTVDGPDDLFAGLTFVSEEHDGVTRDNAGAVRPRHVRAFPDGLWQMIIENGRSRVYLGVHWVFDAFATKAAPHPVNGAPDLTRQVGGVKLGLDIANEIATTGLKRSATVAT